MNGNFRWVLLGVLALLLPACAVTPRPQLPQPPAPRAVAFTVWAGDAAVRTGTVWLSVDQRTADVPCQLREDGGWLCSLPPDVPAAVGAWLHIEGIEGYQPFAQRLAIFAPRGAQGLCESVETVFGGCLDNVALTPSHVDAPWLPRFTRVGQFFRSGGDRYTGIGASDFDLFEKFLAGGEDAIAGVLAQRAHPWGDDRPGFNWLRVWTAFDVCPDGHCPPSNQRIGRLVPSEHADFYGQLRAFARVLSNHGFYVELTAFTGNWRQVDVQAHWAALTAVAADCPNVVLDGINEWDHPAMAGFDPAWLSEPPPPIIASRGSGNADSPPAQPVFRDLATGHPGFGDEWPRKAIHNGWEDIAERFHVAAVMDEMTRFPDGDSDPQHAYDVGRGCALMVAGCVFHSVHGKSSDLWDATELALAQRWVEGARSMPLECQDGGYRHLTERENDAVIRSYTRGANPACIVDVHR